MLFKVILFLFLKIAFIEVAFAHLIAESVMRYFCKRLKVSIFLCVCLKCL